jgi:hypothetical protein
LVNCLLLIIWVTVALINQINNNCWVDDPDNNYYCSDKLSSAFFAGNTSMNVICNLRDFDPPLTGFSTDLTNETWAWTKIPNYDFNKPNFNLDKRLCIICGISDITAQFSSDQKLTTAKGFTYPKDGDVPSISFVLNQRIINDWSNFSDAVKIRTGTIIHELGHGVGVHGDDDHVDINGNLAPNLNPAHNPTDDINCIMRSPVTISSCTNPYFCTGHQGFFKGTVPYTNGGYSWIYN